MPFTPFHLGPALAIGLPLRKYLHAPTFIIANIIVDIEPFTVLLFGLKYPLHGYLHTFIGSALLGGVLGYLMYCFKNRLRTLWIDLRLVNDEYNLRNYVIAGVVGTTLHVLLDSPLYIDIKPFYPILINPLYYPRLSPIIYGLCTIMLIIGSLYYIKLLIARNNLFTL